MATSKKIVMAAAGGGETELFSFTSFTFTAAGVTGKDGPSLATLLAHSTYSSKTSTNTWLTNTSYFNMSTTGIQQFTVPISGTYRIRAIGGSGGQHTGTFHPAFPGAGANIIADFSLSQNDVLNIVVGQQPSAVNGVSSTINGSAGGGGSWVYTGSIGGSGLIICAGGGGGTGHGSSSSPATGGNGRGGNNANTSNESGSIATYGVNSRTGNRQCGNKGTGEGGKSTLTGGNTLTYGGSGGGAGWNSDGDDYVSRSAYGGDRFVGGVGDVGGHSNGGFGGGGGSGGGGNAGGGGGGYTGGGAGDGYVTVVSSKNSWGGGGGGGSFVKSGATNSTLTQGNSGINYSDTTNGSVYIEKIA